MALERKKEACDMTSRDGLDQPFRPVSNTDLSNLYAAFVPTLAFLDAAAAAVDKRRHNYRAPIRRERSADTYCVASSF